MAYHDVERGVCLLVLLQFDLTEHEVVPGAVVEGIDGQGLAVVFLCQGIAVLIDAAEGTQDVVVEGVGVTFQGIVAVYLCSLIVLEVVLCDGAVEVGFSEPGLCGDDHIEALYGKHIVLVVQCIAPHEQDAVCVDLGPQALAVDHLPLTIHLLQVKVEHAQKHGYKQVQTFYLHDALTVNGRWSVVNDA